ncbi:MAG: AAA family ATPase [Kurthia sp.]|nr:AAA family ATPase [Candidatus Kurthia equi]
MKNVLAKQVAEGLGLDFYFTNAVTQEHKLTGFIDANGVYHETQFYKAFTEGGLFFLDEMDASIPEVLIVLNAAIANGYFDFPVGKIEAHPNFRVLAAGNTLGTGADNQYTGRYCLDRASLDRFAIVKIDYSPAIDAEMCGGDEALLLFGQWFRAVADKAGIQCVCSYRSLDRIHKLEQLQKFDMKDIMRMALIKDLDDDDVHVLYNELSKLIPSNKYVEGLR